MPGSRSLLFHGEMPLSARVHRATGDLLERQPAVLITGSWLTVKEQIADRYARALAERGYTAVTFDFAGFGGSGGGPRQAHIPAPQSEDITAPARPVSTPALVPARA